HAEASALVTTVSEVKQTAELVIDEFEKVLAVKSAAERALRTAEEEQSRLFTDIRPETWRTVDHFVDAMARLRRQRGQLITLKDMRYMNVARVDALEGEVSAKFDELSREAVKFLLGEDALAPYREAHDAVFAQIATVKHTPEAKPLYAEL